MTQHFTLQGLMKNPELNGLIGGIQPVTLGDVSARWVSKVFGVGDFGCRLHVEYMSKGG